MGEVGAMADSWCQGELAERRGTRDGTCQTDFRLVTQSDLNKVAAELNSPPLCLDPSGCQFCIFEVHPGVRELRCCEADVSAGELSGFEADYAAGELSVFEGHFAARELSGFEAD